MEKKKNIVADEEQVARIVSNEWVIGGHLQLTAFALAPKETYLSVNRLSVESYEEDVLQFVLAHQGYCNKNKCEDIYYRALLTVKDVRAISVEQDNIRLNANVEVGPRNTHTKSHAGIFVRVDGMNVIKGRQLPEGKLPYNVSEEYLLQRVQWDLLELAELQECKLKQSKS